MIIQSISLLGARPSNEDEIEVVDNLDGKDASQKALTFCAVFDGHGGNGVSRLLKRGSVRLSRFFCSNNVIQAVAPTKAYNKYIQRVYSTVQTKLINHEVKANHMGSTALVALIYKNVGKLHLKVINLGDCRAVACNKYNIAVPLTNDHKPSQLDERRRIQALGGSIDKARGDDPRVSGLSVSRCFGDLDCNYISHDPEVFDYSVKGERFIILACDGVWDVLSNQDAVDFVREQCENAQLRSTDKANDANVANMLGQHAIRKGSTDNISVVIAWFDP